MDTIQTTVFILMVLFHITNVMHGASLGNIKLLNETLDAEEQHRTVLQNIQKNYADEFRNYEMADIENFFAGFMTPVKKEKKPIHTSKTFFGSRERSNDNSHHQTWDPFLANRVIGSQPSYFDVPDDSFQQYIYSKNNGEASYSKMGDDNASDNPRGTEDISEDRDNFPFSEITSYKDKENELSPSKDEEANEDQMHESFHQVKGAKDEVDEISHPVDEDEVNELSHPLDEDAEDEVDELSHPLDEDAEDEVDELSHPLDEDAEDEVDELSRSLDEDANVEVDKLPHPVDDEVDELSHSLDDDTEDEVDEILHLLDDDDHTEDEVDDHSHSLDDDAKNRVDELSQPGDHKLSRPVADDAENQTQELSHPVDETQGQVEERSTSEEDVLVSKDSYMDGVTPELVFSRLSNSTVAEEDGEIVGLDDSTKNQEDVFFQSVDGDAFKNRENEVISEGGDVDSAFFLVDKLSAAKVIEDLKHLNMTKTKNPLENPRTDANILPLDEQNGNESHFGEISDEHLEKVLSSSESGLMKFAEKNFDKASVTTDLDLGKIDIDEFQGSGDMSDDFEALRDTRLESKSGRIINIFPRVNSTAECTTPKGERGHCRSLSQCPLSDPLNNFNLFLQYVCLSRGILVGICCPDNPVVEISDQTENSTGTPVAELKQPMDGCGLNTNTRIVGGKISFPHEWTWMVALLRRNRFFCGGVIINDWYILTAAHCVMGIKVNDLKVRLGEYNFNEKNEHQEDIPVAEIKRHALFVTLTFQHDIALLKLKRRIEYTKFIGSICLPNPKSGNFSNVNATVVGWGTVAFGGTASPVLRQVTVPVWDNDDCDRTYRLERITNAFMCAGSPENGEDACQGDSGGPLMTLSEEGRWEVIGIVSWGRRCGDPTFPGVYTRVTSYLDWITENAN